MYCGDGSYTVLKQNIYTGQNLDTPYTVNVISFSWLLETKSLKHMELQQKDKFYI